MSDDTTPSDLDNRVASTRADLEATLDAIEDKLNVPKRFNELADKTKTAYESNPMPFVVGAVAAAGVIVGLVAWAFLSGDDD